MHGPNSTNSSFHAESTWTKEDKLWLRDFCHEKCLQRESCLLSTMRTLLLEMSTAGVLEQAHNLLNRLQAKRRKDRTEDRPLIFVAHSLGGIVVKRVGLPSPSEQVLAIKTSERYFQGTCHGKSSGAVHANLNIDVWHGILRNTAPRRRICQPRKDRCQDCIRGLFRAQEQLPRCSGKGQYNCQYHNRRLSHIPRGVQSHQLLGDTSTPARRDCRS